MRHERHFTHEEATAALSWVADRLAELRAARVGLTDEDVRATLSEATPGNGGGAAGRHVGEAFVALRSALTQLQGAGVVVRDLERGLVDFPAVIDGREVYLCWHEGETEIAFWHDLDEGFTGRQPL